MSTFTAWLNTLLATAAVLAVLVGASSTLTVVIVR